MQKAAKAQNLHPKTVPFQIFKHAKNSKSSKPTSQNVALPDFCPSASAKNSKNAPNLHPETLPFHIFQHAKPTKTQNLPPKMLPFQIFLHAEYSKSSKPNVAFPNLPTCRKQHSSKPTSENVALPKHQKLKTYIPKSSYMPKTAKAQTYIQKRWLHPKNVTFPNLPTCEKKTAKSKTYITKRCLSKSSNMPTAANAQNLHPKTLHFQIFQHATNSNSSKPTSQKHDLPKSSNIPKVSKPAKAKKLHPNTVHFQIFQDSTSAVTAKAPKLHPKTSPFQILQHSGSAKKQPNRSKSTSQKRYLSKPSNMRTNQQQAQNLHPKTVSFRIFQHVKYSESSKPTPQNVTFPNLPTCEKQQKLKAYIPKRYLSNQHAKTKNSKS